MALFPAKENKELLVEYIPVLEAEVKDVKQEGVKLEVNGVETVAICEKVTMSMIDGKMVTNLF